MTSDAPTDYAVLDSGHGRKLEQFGPVVVDRPCAQAVWRPTLSPPEWAVADAVFSRVEGSQWMFRRELPPFWTTTVGELRFKTVPTEFGHLGLFPEHRACWEWLAACVRRRSAPVRILNLFAYTGAASLAAAAAGAQVCHLDASPKSVTWASENAALNGVRELPIRWIVDDARKFLKREQRRGNRYQGIILDPPSYGRGARQEVFKIDEHLGELLNLCADVLAADPLCVVLTSHTPGYTPLVLRHALAQAMPGSAERIEAGEMTLTGKNAEVLPIPSGTFARWATA